MKPVQLVLLLKRGKFMKSLRREGVCEQIDWKLNPKGTALYGLHGDVPLEIVWFLTSLF